MNNKRTPGEDGINGEVYKSAFEFLPRFITAMYKCCLQRGVFTKRWKRANLIPTVKPGKEKSDEIPNYRPINLLNTGGKVLEKLLIKRSNHHFLAQDNMSKIQFGFSSQRSTTDAAMAVKEFIEVGLSAGEILVLISLDVKGAFDAAWWSSIQNVLKVITTPKTFTKYRKVTLDNGLQFFHLKMYLCREQSPKRPRKNSAAGQVLKQMIQFPF